MTLRAERPKAEDDSQPSTQLRSAYLRTMAEVAFIYWIWEHSVVGLSSFPRIRFELFVLPTLCKQSSNYSRGHWYS